MGKWIIGFLAGVLMGAALTGCATSNTALSDKFDEKTVEAECARSIEYFNDRDYQAILDMGSDEMKAALTAEGFAEQCDPILDKCGTFKEIKKTTVMGSKDAKTGAEFGGAVVVAEYEENNIQFTIGFDEEMKLVQFQLK